MINYKKLYNDFKSASRAGMTSAERKIEDDHMLRRMQEEEFERARLADLNAKKQEEEEKEKLILEEKKKKMKKIEDMKMKQDIEEKKESIAPEPDPSDPNTCEIAFRLPSGKRIIRRFLKTATIGALYNYIRFLEGENLEENNFEISQAVPKKVYLAKERTLEQEGFSVKTAVQVALTEPD